MPFTLKSYLRASAADLADVTVMKLWLFGRPFGLLQLTLMKHGSLIGVASWGCHHVAACVAP